MPAIDVPDRMFFLLAVTELTGFDKTAETFLNLRSRPTDAFSRSTVYIDKLLSQNLSNSLNFVVLSKSLHRDHIFH